MALEDILRALEDKAEASIDDIKSEAQRRANEIKAEVETEAAKMRRARLKKIEDTVRSEATAIVYSAQLKAKKELIKAQEDTVEEAFRQAEKRVGSLGQEQDYPRILEALLDECLDYIEGDVLLQARDDDRAVLEKIMAGKQVAYRFSDTPLEASGGLVASSVDGEIMVLNTFESRLDRAKDKLRLDISSVLFKDLDVN